MIALAPSGELCAHLGGIWGDLLSLGRGPGPLTPLLRLGWQEGAEVAPQRRLLIREEDGEIWVLEPTTGPLLKPPLRVRRITFAGEERPNPERRTSEEGPPLSAYLERTLPGPLHITLAGIAPDRPAPLCRTLTLALVADLLRKPSWASGTPLETGETLWIPVREEGLLEGSRLHRGPASRAVERVGDHVVCVGRGGLFMDGRWQAAAGPDWPPYRGPLSGLALEAQGGLLLLSPAGGPLARVGGAGGRASLPPGAYSALVSLRNESFGVAEGRAPVLVPVRFDTPA